VTEPASAPEAMAVGAVCWSTPGTIESFSSRGPTIDGRVKPDIAAQDRVSGGTYGAASGCGAGFAGTSAAAPHVAGAAALLEQDRGDLKPRKLQGALENQVVDPGAPGKDNAFGAGWLALMRPDMMIRRDGAGSFRGSNVYTRDGTGQATIAKIDPGKGAGFDLLLQNDTPGVKGYSLRAPRDSRWFRIRYLYGALDITSSVQGAGAGPLLFGAGGAELFELKVRAKKGAAGRRARIPVHGVGKGGILDTVVATVKVRR
jgi:hypothetical protein